MRGNLVVKSSSSENNNNNINNSYSVMNRVMLRFRPIAPKPPGRENLADLDKRNGSVKRTKRKYVRVRCRQTKRKNTEKASAKPTHSYVTLQLLPERSESEQICSVDENRENNNNNNNNSFQLTQVDERGYMEEVKRSLRCAVETWIIVEGVTETFTNNNGVGLGFTDKERVSNLEADTCPGLVSDGSNKVVWVNEAYRRMVMVEEEEEGGVYVSLVVNEKLPYFCPSFACRVRLIQGSKHGNNNKYNKIMPCDVWRMEEFQGFAWKLDLNTALSL